MNNRCFMLTYRISASLVIALSSGLTYASSAIWSSTSGMGAGPAAAMFNINTGTTATSTQTVLNYYTDTNCTTPQSGFSTNGAYTFKSGSYAQANATSIYNLNPQTSVQSIEVIPQNGSTNIFTTTPCFTVICSSLSSTCQTTTVATVNLA